MKKNLLIIVALSLLVATTLAASPNVSQWGARAAAADTNRSIEEMLRYAIEDEYLAHAEYAAILSSYGNVRPFSNIIETEARHIGWLKDAYAAAGLPVPKDEAAGLAIVPVSLKASFEAGVGAEVDNIAMYDSFLASDLLKKPENASYVSLFVRLRDASKNHLAAFQNGLSRY
jgi:hypothetical protein